MFTNGEEYARISSKLHVELPSSLSPSLVVRSQLRALYATSNGNTSLLYST